MSVNVGDKGLDRGKRLIPSNSKKAKSISPKTETSKPVNKSALQTLDKFLIKKPASVSSNKTSNNSPKNESTGNVKLKDKAGNSNGSVTDVTEKANVIKETTPEPDFIVVDDSQSDFDIPVDAKVNGSKEEQSAAISEGKNGNRTVDAPLPEEKQCELSDCEHKSKADDGNSTDEIRSEQDKADNQEYDLISAEDAQTYIDYKEEDFITDSDLEESEGETEREGQSDSGASGSKKKTAVMGGFFSRRNNTNKRRRNYESSSSDDDSSRPWRQSSSPSTSQDQRSRPIMKRSKFPLKKQWSDRDTLEYREGYPNKKDDKNLNLNLQFYQGKIRSKPDGAYIDEFHSHWWYNYDRLESHHGYIQWLFPIRESGMNYQAQELQLHEAKAIQNDPQAMERFTKSYEMMLNFYGIALIDRRTGQVKRAENWRPRFRHLDSSAHNYLRITRILKCLGELGLEHYKSPFLKLLLHEAIVTGMLRRTLSSCCNYWIGTVKDDLERQCLLRLAEKTQREGCR